MQGQNFNLKNRVHIIPFLLITISYLVITTFIYMFLYDECWSCSDSGVVIYTLGFLFACGICMIITISIIRTERMRSQGDTAQTFKRFGMFNRFGSRIWSFEHDFTCDKPLSLTFLQNVDRAFKGITKDVDFKALDFNDRDRKLINHESRHFCASEIFRTSRGTRYSLVLRTEAIGKVQSFSWWVVAGGYESNTKKFVTVSLSPLTIWFWIIPKLRGRTIVRNSILEIYNSDFERIDATARLRIIQRTTFKELVSLLEENGVDISYLKQQSAQIMNITVAGNGRASFGNIIQGQSNSVDSRMGSA
ncbi:hypothetical protein CLV74_11852 [Donghicola tyrosinivorans]|uniref:Uncharacterized protein n=1 Tax=Donghicola tyrosinivorans TaxID=1652492 RepID=A0A2T0WEG0_9RHOB|nr:hypothetical protein CLV74_11852 [Donghicola tyrosinivorans]